MVLLTVGKICTVPNYFIDTNILGYTVDARDKRKQSIARNLITKLVSKNECYISTQVLQEFFNVAIKRLSYSKEEAKTLIQTAETLPVISVTPSLINTAIDISIQTQFSFWDSLFIATAQNANCSILYTKDLNDGQIVGNVTITNPFK